MGAGNLDSLSAAPRLTCAFDFRFSVLPIVFATLNRSSLPISPHPDCGGIPNQPAALH